MRPFKFVSACLAVSAATFVLPAQAQSVTGQGTWESTLKGRDINFNAVAATDASAVYLYDTTLDVTWLRNANYANGLMYWHTAYTWAADLTTGSGVNEVSDWRLPTMTVADPNEDISYTGTTDFGYNMPGSSSEMASLWYFTLGNKAYCDPGLSTTSSCVQQTGWGLTNTGSFQNMQSVGYWLGTEYAPSAGYSLYFAWYFNAFNGYQLAAYKTTKFYAMAVRSGDVHVASVPEPETYAMMLAGLAMVGALSRRRSRAMRSLAL
jgi:hypothetical protein